MSKIILKPSKEGLKVHNPKTGRDLKKDGELVDLTIYWRRMIKCGDVIQIEETKKEIKNNKPKKINSNIESKSEE